MSRRRVVLELTDHQRGLVREALMLGAISADRARQQRTVRQMDDLVQQLDDAWDAAAGRRRLYGRLGVEALKPDA